MTDRSDPLLRAARLILTLIMVALGVLLVGILIGAPLILAFHDRVIAALADEHGPIAHPWAVIWAFETILALSFAMALCVRTATAHLRRIVDSVGAGDPFIPENAQRLRVMGWLSLASHLFAGPAAMVADWLEHQIKGAHFGFSISLSGILLTVLLFILARVFERGTVMRDDLEGTV